MGKDDIAQSINASEQKQPCVFDMSHLGSIYVHGKDAQNFLQGQLTCDVTLLPPLKAQPTACCNLQGRIIAIFFVMIWHEGYLLILPKRILESTVKHLKKYAVFSKIVFNTVHEHTLIGFSQAPAEEAYQCLDNLYIAVGSQKNQAEEVTTKRLGSIAWHYQQMIRGLPDIYPETQGTLLPHRIGLQNIEDAINFKKGCYLGQEIIARTHFKATLKHAVYLCEADKMTFHLGDTIMDKSGTESLGEIFDIATPYFLAALKMESLANLPENIKITYQF